MKLKFIFIFNNVSLNLSEKIDVIRTNKTGMTLYTLQTELFSLNDASKFVTIVISIYRLAYELIWQHIVKKHMKVQFKNLQTVKNMSKQ